ncbi:MAG: hypothetical protein V2A55_01180 [Candidatus Jorgensenbacteria bacterium]
MTARVLKFLSTEKTLWKLLLKTFLGSLAVFLVYNSGFNPFLVIVAALVFAVIYFREIEEKAFFRTSFWLLPILALAASGVMGSVGPIAVFAALFFVLLGLINLFFKERFLVYGIFNAAFLVALLLFFFYLVGPGSFWILGAVSLVTVFLVLKEAFNFLGPLSGRRAVIFAGVLAFLGLELSYILQFLPLGFINAAVYLTLFLVLGRETVVSSVKGSLNFSQTMKQITLFVVLSIVVFAVSFS